MFFFALSYTRSRKNTRQLFLPRKCGQNPRGTEATLCAITKKNLSDWLQGRLWEEERSPSCSLYTTRLTSWQKGQFTHFTFSHWSSSVGATMSSRRSSSVRADLLFLVSDHKEKLNDPFIGLNLSFPTYLVSVWLLDVFKLPVRARVPNSTIFFPLLKHTNTSGYDPTLTTTVCCREGSQQTGISPRDTSAQTQWTDAALGCAAGLQRHWGNVCLRLCTAR